MYGKKEIRLPLFEIRVGINGEMQTAVESNFIEHDGIAFDEEQKKKFNDRMEAAMAAFIRKLTADVVAEGDLSEKGVEIGGPGAESGPIAEVAAELNAKRIEPVAEEAIPEGSFRQFYSLLMEVNDEGHARALCNYQGDNLANEPAVPPEVAAACCAAAMTISALAQVLTNGICMEQHEEESTDDDSNDDEIKTDSSGKRIYPPNIH